MIETWNNYASFIASAIAIIFAVIQFVRWIRKDRIKEEPVTQDESVADRFILLFEKNGVHRNQIPRFFGHGLTPYDVSSSDKLLPKLTPDILQAACNLFAVRLEWLEGVSAEIYPSHHFYKQPEQFQSFLTELKSNGEPYRLLVKLIVSNSSKNNYNAVLIVEEIIDYIDNSPVIRYHLCDQWLHTYWKARADLAACIAIACNQLGGVKGFQTKVDIGDFSCGERFLLDIFDLPRQKKLRSLPEKQQQLWQPEDWAADPESFLDGVDEHDFGKVNALARWLEYAKAGYMDTKFPEYANAKELFVKALNVKSR